VSERNRDRDRRRCKPGRPCEDVLAFVRGAERDRDVDGVDENRRDEIIAVLRDKARRTAEAHNYGLPLDGRVREVLVRDDAR